MINERGIKAIIYSTAGLWATALWFSGQSISSTWFQPLSAVSSIVIVGAIFFDLWGWKLPLINQWLVKRPILEGTWSVTLISNWVNPTTGERIAPINAYMVIRQTLSTLSMRLLTKESSSALIGTEITCSTDGLFCVSGVYRNEPQFQFRHRSEIHYGGIWLEVTEQPKGLIMKGHYWTDRNTAGSMELRNHAKKKYQTFMAAQEAFSDAAN